jgi:aldehyde:ferredoxin oxidoreductase
MTAGRAPTDFSFCRFHVDLTAGSVRKERVDCQDLEDVLGGVGRGFKLLEDRAITDAYAPEAALILNLGILSGTEFMTGLRTFFHGYSPLKASVGGVPAAMWTAGSGKFGTKLRALGIEEVVFVGRCEKPALLHLTDGPEFQFEDAADLVGLGVHAKIQKLHERFPQAHFAVIGPAGENYKTVRYAAIGLSTENQLRSGDPKPRFCGRGGFGGVLGSKNLLAIVADGADRKGASASPLLKKLNLEVARGEGSRRFRDKDKGNGLGGTWANYEALNPVHAMPEMNFDPTGTDASVPLYRENVEKGPYVIKDEACYRCGIKCHKNIYDRTGDGKAGKFRAKLDFEPLCLLSSNLGIFDIDKACDLVELVDELGMDSISLGVTLSYAMEYNKRHPDAPIAGGLAFGDVAATDKAIRAIAAGELELLGQGVKRASESLGETGYAMHCKGVEFPAYLPQTNPGYPWALAGGHMSMSTYLVYLYDRETGVDYWVDKITRSGPLIMRDDMLGICKFAGMSNKDMVAAITELIGLELDAGALKRAVMRTYLRGYRLEKRQGFTGNDYVLPEETHNEYPRIDLPFFISKEFFADLRQRVTTRFDELAAAEGL